MQKTTKRLNNWTDLWDTYDNPHGISRQEFRIILYTFNSLLAHQAIFEGKSFILPENCGVFTILKSKTSKRGYFDYESFNKFGIKRWIHNNHSGGFKGTVKWLITPHTGPFPSIVCNLHQFKAARQVNRTLATAIKDFNTISLYYDD